MPKKTSSYYAVRSNSSRMEVCILCHKRCKRLKQHLEGSPSCKLAYQRSLSSRKIKISNQDTSTSNLSTSETVDFIEKETTSSCNGPSELNSHQDDDKYCVKSTVNQSHELTHTYEFCDLGQNIPPTRENIEDLTSENEFCTMESFMKGLQLTTLYNDIQISRYNMSISRKQLMSLKLFQILHKANASISLYKEIQEFIENCVPIMKGEDSPYILSRETLLRDMHDKIIFKSSDNRKKKRKNSSSHINDSDINTNHCSQNQPYTFHPSLKPKLSKITLKNLNRMYDVATFCPISSIISLLNDPSINTIKNTLYNEKQYLNPVLTQSESYGDIHTSQWFRNAHQKMISPLDYNKVLLCPLLFFIDGTAIGAYSNKSLEPVSFTLCIFNRETRNLHHSWRVLGYVPNTEKCFNIKYSSGKEGSHLKRVHYHQLLSVIFGPLKKLQDIGGLKWKLPFKTTGCDGKEMVEYREVQLLFPIMTIVGDAVGNNKLCCHKQNFSYTKLLDTGVCRDCNVTFRHCDNPKFHCDLTGREDVK